MGTTPRQKKTGASPRSTTKIPSTGSKSWLWLLTGILLGAGSVTLWHIDTHPTQLGNIACGPNGTPSATSSSTPHQGNEPAPHFDFYNLLPGQPAITSSSTQAQETQHAIHASPPPKKSPGMVAVESGTSLPHPAAKASIAYLLQCGSFATMSEADSRRAAIIMLGFSAEVHPVKAANNPAHYRVMVGPFDDHQKAVAISHQLTLHGLASIIVKKAKPSPPHHP